MPWFVQGADYLHFANGAASFLLGFVAYLTGRAHGRRTGITFLALFGVIHGITEWVSIPLETFGLVGILGAVQLAGTVAAYLCLLELGRFELAAPPRRFPGLWIHAPVLILAITPGLFGLEPFAVWLRYAVVVPSALIAAAGVWLQGAGSPTTRVRRPLSASIALSALVLALTPLLDTLQPRQAPGLLAVSISGGLHLLAAVILLHGLELGLGQTHRKALRMPLGIGALSAGMLAGAWVFANVLGDSALQSLKAEGVAVSAPMVDALERRMEQADALALLLSTSPDVITYLQGGEQDAPAALRRVLDRYGNVWAGTVTYLMDMEGHVRAASSSGDSEVRTGDDHGALAYFRDATTMETARSLEAGLGASGRRYRAAHVVRSASGTSIGVAAVLRPESASGVLDIGKGRAFLVHAGGGIYGSNDPQHQTGQLWPGASRQPGPLPLFDHEPTDGEIVSTRGRAVLVTRTYTGAAGLSLIHLADPTAVGIYRALAMLVLSVTGAVGFAFLGDRTMRASSAARLAASETRYRAVVDASPAWVTLLDARGRVVLTNGHREGLSSSGGSIVAGSAYQEGWPPAARPGVALTLAALEGANEARREIAWPGPDLGSVWNLTLSRIALRSMSDPEAAIVAVATNITDQRDAEQVTMIAERTGGIGTLAAGVAHQFNNIHAGISGYVQMAMLEPQSPDGMRHLEAADRLLRRATDVTTRLLEFARPASPDREPLLVGHLVREVLALLADELHRDGIEVVAIIEDTEPVLADSGRIKYVLVSLVDNARHVAALGHPRRITVRTHVRERWLHLHVGNTGPSIPAEALPRLFVPFFSLKGEWAPSGSGLATVRGYGLSLSVCHAIVTGHGGTITAMSEEGQETSFRVVLPLTAPLG